MSNVATSRSAGRIGWTGVAATLAAVAVLLIGTGTAGAHSGGTDENGCHAGSRPYHCHNGGTVDSPSAPAATTPPPEVLGLTQQPGCDPNYEGACVPVSSADVDCSQVSGNNFRVVGEDIHRLDEGGTPGIACEDDSAGTGGSTAAEVADAASAPPSNSELATTGRTSGPLSLGAVGLMLGGLLLLIGAAVAPPPRLRGGFTLTTTNRHGEQIVRRVTSRGAKRTR